MNKHVCTNPECGCTFHPCNEPYCEECLKHGWRPVTQATTGSWWGLKWCTLPYLPGLRVTG